jgi:hypothetical protein
MGLSEKQWNKNWHLFQKEKRKKYGNVRNRIWLAMSGWDQHDFEDTWQEVHAIRHTRTQIKPRNWTCDKLSCVLRGGGEEYKHFASLFLYCTHIVQRWQVEVTSKASRLKLQPRRRL